MKGALLGFGQIAEKAHLPAFRALRDHFSIEAVVESSPGRRRAAQEAFPGAALFSSAAELWGAGLSLDFVDIATPPHLHPALAGAALAHGMHVLCEKPLVLKNGEFETLRRNQNEANKVLYTVHNWKHAPLFRKAWELIDEGAVGNVRHVDLHVIRTQPSVTAGDADNWRANPKFSGGGIVVDHGWHQFYLLQNLVRRSPLFVKAAMHEGAQGAAELEASVMIQYPEATATLYLTWLGASRRNWGIVYGEDGTLELADDRVLHTPRRGKTKAYSAGPKVSGGSAHPEWFEQSLLDFKEEIETPGTRGANLAEAELCVILISHALQSHRLGGRTVPLPVPLLGGVRAPART